MFDYWFWVLGYWLDVMFAVVVFRFADCLGLGLSVLGFLLIVGCGYTKILCSWLDFGC